MSETKHSPLPWTADISDRATDGSDCWVVDGPDGSIAEMMCPADIEQANAEFIVRAVNAHEALMEVAYALIGGVEICPNCNNVGYYAAGATDNPEQVQCEFCYTVTNSLFNIKEKARTALAEGESK